MSVNVSLRTEKSIVQEIPYKIFPCWPFPFGYLCASCCMKLSLCVRASPLFDVLVCCCGGCLIVIIILVLGVLRPPRRRSTCD